MGNNRNLLATILRIVVAFLFILSAIAKMYPSPYFAISTFEVKQLYPLGFSPDLAVYFSRTLIGIELALGILLLQRNYLKRFVIPATILMLLVFTGHLIIQATIYGANSGNCGCFGSLMPMTPLESIIKNVVAIILLVWILKMLPKAYDYNNFWVLTTVLFATILAVYMIAPIQPQTNPEYVNTNGGITVDTTAIDETQNAIVPADSTAAPAPDNEQATAKPDTQTTAPVADNGPTPVTSKYSKYFPDADKGKKIIGLFVPGCDHCRDAAKELTELKAKNKDFPKLEIIFMDEEAEKIPEFFDYAGAKYPYKIIDVITFWNVLGNDKDTPGVVYLWNGNVVKSWEGITDNKFHGDQLMKVLNKKQ